MMKSKELRARAWASLKGKYWMAFAVSLVVGFLASFGTSAISLSQDLMEVLGLVDPAEMDETMKLGATVLVGAASVITIIGFLISVFVESAAQVGICNYFINPLLARG